VQEDVKHYRRADDSWIAVERSPALEREIERSFDDEVAIDFPAVGDKVERMCHAFIESDSTVDRLRAEICLSRRQAGIGAAVPLEVPVRSTCRGCGGRGEVWGDTCPACAGSGHAFHRQTLTVSVPAGVVHGARFTFSVSRPRGPRTRIEVRVAVT
jgi:DnaJ-class molecular chaperone